MILMTYKIALSEFRLSYAVSNQNSLFKHLVHELIWLDPLIWWLVILIVIFEFLNKRKFEFVNWELTLIAIKLLIDPDYTWIPVLVTSITRPSSTSPTSGVHVIALKLTVKMTSPLVSWITPSPIRQSLSF